MLHIALMTVPGGIYGQGSLGVLPDVADRLAGDNGPMTNYSPPPSGPLGPSPASGRPKLRRSTSDRMVAGVAGGLARHLDLDVTAVRFGFVAASLLLLGGIGGPILYLAAWALVPEDGQETSIAPGTLPGKPWESWGGSTQSATGATP